MKKGFTLAELLGVIAILGIIALIAAPIVNNSINESDEELYQTQLNQIIKGAKSYYAEHLDELPQNNGDKVTITLKKLQDEGYLPLEANNPKTGDRLNPNLTIIVTKNGQTLNYQVDETTIEDN